MAAESPEKATCAGCGASLGPQMRYCPSCYRPVKGATRSHAHVEVARQVDTTHRSDPTVVFLPEVREAQRRRSKRLKRSAIAGTILAALIGCVLTFWLALGHQTREQRRSMARVEMARRELASMAEALERFREDVGRYPTNVEGLAGLMHRPVAFRPTDDPRLTRWLGPYLDSLPEVDPWGEDYVYETTEGGRSFRLYSHGPSGESNGAEALQVSSSGPA